MSNKSDTSLINHAAAIVSAYLRNNFVPATEVPSVVYRVHAELQRLKIGEASTAEGLKPAVPIKKSVHDDYLICLEDGKKLRMLKRYLRSQYGMTVEEYRKKWDLPYDYPMVAPAYARQRSAFAKKIGLGRISTTAARSRKKSS